MSKVGYYECSYCSFRAKKYNGWRKHLLEESHQIQVRGRVNGFSRKEKKRCAVIYGIINVKESEVLKYFGDITIVSNLIYWTERKDFCIIQFLVGSFRDNIFNSTHTINGQILLLRAREDILDVEWLSICPFMLPEVKMEVDLEVNGLPDDLFQESSSDESESEISSRTVTSSIVTDQLLAQAEDYDSEDSCRTTLLNVNGNKDINLNGSEEFGSSREDDDDAHITIEDCGTEHYSMESDTVVVDFHGTNGSVNEQTEQEESNNLSLSQSEENTNRELETTPAQIVIGQGQEKLPKLHPGWIELNLRFEGLYHDNLMPPRDWDTRKRVRDKLEHLFHSVFPNCIVIPFGAGSTAISSGREIFSLFIDIWGLTSNGNDNDVDSQDTPRNRRQRQRITPPRDDSLSMERNMSLQVPFMDKLIEFLKSIDHVANEIFDVKVIFNIKTQREDEILFTFSEENMKCKLQGSNFLAVQCCRIINFMCTLDPRVRPLLIIARYWSSAHRLVQSHPKDGRSINEHFHPALIQWLVLNYLAYIGVIPTVADIQRSPCLPLYLNNVNVAFCNNPLELVWGKKKFRSFIVDPVTGNPSALSMLKLASEMFSFYGRMNYDKIFINISQASLISRLNYPRGVNNIKDEERMVCCNLDKPMLVQHPLMLFINMTNNVSLDLLKEFKNGCRNTVKNIKLMLKKGVPMQLLNPLDVLTPKVCRIKPLLNCKKIPDRDSEDTNSQSEPVSIEIDDEPSHSHRSTPLNNSEAEVEPVPTVSTIVSPSTSKTAKAKNHKPFNIQLPITNAFRKTAGLVTNHRLKTLLEEDLFDVWQTFVQDFNETVWPVCFGIKLRLNRVNESDYPPIYEGTGILIEDKKMTWITKVRKLNSKKEKLAFENLRLMLLQRRRADNILQMSDTDSNTDTRNTSLRFKLRISFIRGRNHLKGQVDVRFTKVTGTVITTSIRRKLLVQIYTKLWGCYVLDRLCKV